MSSTQTQSPFLGPTTFSFQQINKILSDYNITKQTCDSKGNISYLMADLQLPAASAEAELQGLYDSVNSVPENVATRILY